MKDDIRLLPTEFIGKGEVKGFQFRQLTRGQKACLYSIIDEGRIHYEVFTIRVGKLPRTAELYEPYPKANSFGIWAWAYRNYEKAIEKYQKLERHEKEQ